MSSAKKNATPTRMSREALNGRGAFAIEWIIFFAVVFLLLPVLIQEYLILIYIMGSGAFALAASAIVFILCVAGHVWPIRKFRDKVMLRVGLMVSLLVSSPFITVIAVMALAKAFGFEVKIE